MKDDKLKAFIQENQEAFNFEEPSGQLWNEVEGRLEQNTPSEPRMRVPFMAIAASICALLAVGIYYVNTSTAEVKNTSLVQEELQQMESGMAEINHYYAMQISDKTDELNGFEVDPEMLEEMELLTTEFEELQNELKVGANPELVIEAMIENYRIRIQLLEDLLRALKNERNTVNEINDDIA